MTLFVEMECLCISHFRVCDRFQLDCWGRSVEQFHSALEVEGILTTCKKLSFQMNFCCFFGRKLVVKLFCFPQNHLVEALAARQQKSKPIMHGNLGDLVCLLILVLAHALVFAHQPSNFHDFHTKCSFLPITNSASSTPLSTVPTSLQTNFTCQNCVWHERHCLCSLHDLTINARAS